MDEIVHEQHGLYGINYPASIDLYESYLAEADDQYMSRFHDLLLEKQNIIAERSFYAREDRNTFREMARGAGANVVLVFLEVTDKELLWQRICTRSQDPKTADSAFDIGRETFEMYWNGFEDPVDEEGALVVNVM